MFELLSNAAILDAGLQSFQTWLVNNWLAPAFFIIVAVFGVIMAVKKKPREAITLGIVAVVGAVFIFAAEALIGRGSSGLSGAVTEGVRQVQTIGIYLGLF